LGGRQSGKLWFDMGHSCPGDFREIAFLGVNGYGRGASKVLRGLYERAVTLAYLDFFTLFKKMLTRIFPS
jgi:hypothetical protein